MSEIRLSVQFGHPPELVWRALTERRLLSRWFMLTDFAPARGTRFELLPETMPGFEGRVTGEVIEVELGRRLVMRWHGEQLHCRVTWELSGTREGSLLVVTQSGFLGLRGTARRRQLVATYRQLFGVRLLAVLDGLATGADVAVPPPPAAPEPAGPDRRRQLLAVGAAALLIALAAVLVANLPEGTSEPVAAQTASTPPAAASATAPTGQRTSGPARSPRTSAAPATPTGSASPGTTPAGAAPATTAPAAPAALAARYRTVSTGLLGYRGEVEASNTGGTAAPGWTVTLTVAPLAVVSRVEGPPPEQNGTTVRFTGTALEPGTTARIVFDVGLDATLLGPKKPSACAIDSSACAGL
ncbi:SRPBCC domain-containing protein [Actinomycetes bacterium KLBMP 9797]